MSIKNLKSTTSIVEKGNFSKKKNSKWIIAAILFIAVIAFSNSIKNDFLTNWDDNTYIINNPQVKDFSWQGIKNIFSNYQIGNYHPLTMLCYTVEYKLFGLNPKAFHFFNLFFHLLNIILVFQLVLLLSGRFETSIITSTLFAIHPMHVESVAWISETKDVLYSFYFLSTLICYILYLKQGQQKYYIFSLLLFICSLLSKSAAVILPILLILFDYYLNKPFNKKMFFEKIPFFILSIILGFIALDSQSSSGAIDLAPHYSLFDRLFIANYAVVIYLFKLFSPISLSAMYGYPIKADNLLPIIYYISPVFILSFVLLIIKSKSALKKELIFGSLFFIITISLVLQILPFGRALIAERYTYIPYIGLFYMVGSFYSLINENKIDMKYNLKSYFQYILVSVVLIFSIVTWNRNKVWKNGYTLFSDVIEKDPNIGYAYFARAEAKDDMHDYVGAITDFTKSIEFNPSFMDAYLNRGVMKHNLKDNKGAVEDFTKAITISPKNAALYMNRGICKLDLNLGKDACNDFQKAASMKFESANIMIQKYCK